MRTPYAQLLEQLKAAQGDTARLALVTFDFAVAHDPILKMAAEVAAIPHWFDAKSLAALLPDHAAHANGLLEQLKALPMVEPYTRDNGGPAWNIHEATRLALRDRLWENEPERFKELSRRAAVAYGTADSADPDFVLTCEHLYHALAGQTAAGETALDRVAGNWDGAFRKEPLQTLAAMLEELLSAKSPPPVLRRGQALSHKVIADARRNHQPASITIRSLEKAQAIFRSLVASDPANSQIQRHLFVVLNHLGELAVAQGDLAKALGSFTDAKIIVERLGANEPSVALWQHDLSLSQFKIADVLQAQGDLEGALHFFTESTAIAEASVSKKPSSAVSQFNLGVMYERLGDLAFEQGNLADALGFYTKRKNMISTLSASDPANWAWQRDLAVALSKLGNVALVQLDPGAAFIHFSESHAIRERLAANDPSNTVCQYDLGIANERLGDLAVQQGKLDEAFVFHSRRHSIVSALVTSDPANAEWQRDLSVSLEKLGDLALAQGDLDRALHYFTEDKNLVERLATSDPSNATWQRDLWISYLKLANLSKRSDELVEAMNWWKKAYEVMAGMKQRGLHVSPQDEHALEWLRAKVGGAK